MPGNLLPQRLLAGVPHRKVNHSSVDSGLAAMLQDERMSLSQRAADKLDLDGTTPPVLDAVVKYQFLGGSDRARREIPLEDDTPVTAFTWLFAIKEVVLTMSSGFEKDPRSMWRLFVYPPRQDVLQVGTPGTSDLPTSFVVPASTAPWVSDMMDVDLGAIASSGFAVRGSRDMVGTLLTLCGTQ